MSQVPPPSKDTLLPPGAQRPASATRPISGGPRTVAQPTRGPISLPVEVGIFDPSQHTPLLLLTGLLGLIVAAYWDMLALTSAAWTDDLYSHGWIIPIFSLGLLWLRWQPFQKNVPDQERWIGVLILGIALGVRLIAAKWTILPVDRWSFLPAIFGAFMLVGGLRAVRWAWPAIIFLFFMFPLPTVAEVIVLNRLQKMATICSTFVLQTIGIAAYREGNSIHIPGMGQALNVAEACAGLRMATIFGALAVAMVFIIDRPWWDKLVILLSSIPIAIIVNIARITVTAVLTTWVGQDNYAVNKICHDYAGYVIMMPLALVLLWIELQILERVTIPVDAVQLRPVGGMRTASVPVR